MNTNEHHKLHYRGWIVVWVISLVYLAFTRAFLGLGPEHYVIVIFYNLCFMLNAGSRKFILAFTVFIVFGIIYGLLKAYPNYLVNNVDISSIYHFEKKIFSFSVEGQRMTPNEYFALHHTTFLDILTGLFYINWIPIPLAFGLWLYFRNKQVFLHFSLTFLFVNLIGFIIYYLHPAAPPWYVKVYGFDFHLDIQGSAAGLARFDTLIHFPLFNSIYSRNSNVFAAMPSLHCAYPVIVLYYAVRSKLGWVNGLFVLFMAGIWFSAVYSGHHYVTDVLMGITCAIIGLFVFQKLLLKNTTFLKFISRYEYAISTAV